MEILSPEDRASWILRKVNDYLRAGVVFVWTIDPKSRDAIVYHSGATQAAAAGILWTRSPDLQIDIAELFDSLILVAGNHGEIPRNRTPEPSSPRGIHR